MEIGREVAISYTISKDVAPLGTDLVRHMTGPSPAPDAPAMACWPARGDDKRPCRPNSPVGPYNSLHPDECAAGGRMYSVGRAAVLLLPAAVLVEVQGGSDDR